MSYRSAQDALRERTRLLEDELRALEDKRRASRHLDDEAARLSDKLQKSKLLLERMEQKRSLPMLDQVKVASPCNADWNQMQGDDKSRYCGKCEKNVYNLSAMSREDAELLILEKEGNLCIRLYRRTDGTVLTEDCPVGVRRKRLRLLGVVAIAGGAVATAAGFAASMLTQMGAPPPQHAQGAAVMGDMEAEREPVPAPPPPPVTAEPVTPKLTPQMGEMARPVAPATPKPLPK
jgi:hypothetical protein